MIHIDISIEKLFDKINKKFSTDLNKIEDIKILDNGLIVAKYKNSKNIIVLGCKLCIINNIKQNKKGYPTLGKIELLYIDDVNFLPEVDIAVRANTWLCPSCYMPQKSLYPKF